MSFWSDVLKLKLILSASTFKKLNAIGAFPTITCILFVLEITKNFLDSLRYSLPRRPNVLDTIKTMSFTLHHYASLQPTQLLPFTCSSNFFCNIALNGLPDVDFGIYNDEF